MKSGLSKINYLIPALALLLLVSFSQFSVTQFSAIIDQKEQQAQKDGNFERNGLCIKWLLDLFAIYIAMAAIAVPFIRTIVSSTADRCNDIVRSLLLHSDCICTKELKELDDRREKANEFSRVFDRWSKTFISFLGLGMLFLIVSILCIFSSSQFNEQYKTVNILNLLTEKITKHS